MEASCVARPFAALVRDVPLDLHRQGARRLVLVDGHHENVWPSVEGVELALDALARDRLDGWKVLRLDLWDVSSAAHDGPARFKPYDRYPEPPAEVPPSGVLSLTAGSSAEKGRWPLDDATAWVAAAVREEFGL